MSPEPREPRRNPALGVLRFLARPRALWLALALGALVSAPAIGTGWFNDDFVMRMLLDEGIEGYPLGPTQLYEFTPPEVSARAAVDRGFLAWFTHEELSIRFFRPLSSLTLALESAVVGRSALLAHVHHLLWFLALVWIVGRVHRRLLRPSAAGLATLLYAIGSAHGLTVAWVSARHVLVGGAFAALSLLLHVGARQTRERWRAIGAPIALIVGLFASEATLGAVAFIVLYEVIQRYDARRERARAAAPSIVIAVAHLALYTTGGWGTRHSGMYLTPWSDPLGYAAAAAVRVPVLLGEAFGGAPSSLSGFGPLAPVLVGWGLLTTAIVLATLKLGRFGRRERWLLASTALALAPVVGGFIGGRLLVVAGIGGSALVATAIVRAASSPPTRWTRAALAILLTLHLGLSVLVRVGVGARMMQLAADEEAHIRGLDVDACGDARLLYSLTGADPSNSMYLASGLLFYAPDRAARFESIRALSMATSDQRFTRDSERSFRLEILGEREVGPIEQVHYDVPPAVGETRTVGELTVEVTAADETSWTAARFETDRPLEEVCFGSWDGETLRLWRAPPIGESRALPHVPGVMGM